MTLFVSHTTAAECWRSGRFDALLGGPSIAARHRPAGSTEVERVASMLAFDRLNLTYGEALGFGTERSDEAAANKPTASAVRSARRTDLAFATDPVHIVTPVKMSSKAIKGAVCHVCTTLLPSGSFVRASNGLLIASPELTFAHAASGLGFPALVKLGMELCSLYTVQPDGTARYERTLPPTTVRALRAFLDRSPSLPGSRAARKALRFVAAASGSPMETALAIALCLPPRFGGYGLPLPRLNHRIDVPRASRTSMEKSYYLIDLYWPEANVGLEYDSDQEHTGSARIAEDALRRNDLLSLGIATITATRRHVVDGRRLDRIAEQLGRALGVRLRSERSGSPEEHARLLRSLISQRDLETSWTKTRRFSISN
ncbi:hypothetical protein BN3658_01674 [Coriobacteriaceae bacterium CHKCI002]|nr:hypothetical protein B5F41_09090 [Gordonibacter sp. An232A]CVH78855.1 hypothetical protein BN3658_01674 [Coriobacteriaceae bacterium CHKCI002]